MKPVYFMCYVDGNKGTPLVASVVVGLLLLRAFGVPSMM
jgi:hypothetical protein